jgi:hypothetical protein
MASPDEKAKGIAFCSVPWGERTVLGAGGSSGNRHESCLGCGTYHKSEYQAAVGGRKWEELGRGPISEAAPAAVGLVLGALGDGDV